MLQLLMELYPPYPERVRSIFFIGVPLICFLISLIIYHPSVVSLNSLLVPLSLHFIVNFKDRARGKMIDISLNVSHITRQGDL